LRRPYRFDHSWPPNQHHPPAYLPTSPARAPSTPPPPTDPPAIDLATTVPSTTDPSTINHKRNTRLLSASPKRERGKFGASRDPNRTRSRFWATRWHPFGTRSCFGEKHWHHKPRN
jgi:hypothetical protein